MQNQPLRDLYYAIDALGKLHIDNANWDEALRTYHDMLRLADRAERGGLLNDMFMGNSFAATSVERFGRIVPALTVSQSHALIQILLDYEQGQEPLSVIVDRDELTTRTYGKWAGRWIECVETIAGHPRRRPLDGVRRRSNARTRVLVCDLAVNAYWLDHGSLPREAGELVPGYLTEIPLDPWDERPIKLVFRDGEYLVYSVGPNGRDDGGIPERDTGDWPVTQRKLAEAKK